MSLRALFLEHVETLQQRTEETLRDLHLDGLLISAGSPLVYFEDDQDVLFRSNHHFRHWCPLEGPYHLLLIVPGEKPRLRVYQPADFWHEVKPLESDFWTDAFTIEVFTDVDEMWKVLPSSAGNIAYHGPDLDKARAASLRVELPGLLPRLNWNRLVKTPYEQQCLVDATRLAAKGHKAAERAFHQGGSELDIHFAYLNATRCRDQDLPYENIICLNEKAAFLHYSAKRDDIHNGRVLLIDAGAQARGYAADITRTYATEDAPEEFRALLDDVIVMQKEICDSIRIGSRMNDLHYNTHERIAALLIRHGILINCDEAKALKDGYTSAFFPHGLGHGLGIFVHDVAGRQADKNGTLGEPDPRFPRLRNVRPLEVGNYVTIEPGVYFIKMLLDPFRGGEHGVCFNWGLIDRLMPCGGIRIEDDILVLEDRIRNVTREFLP